MSELKKIHSQAVQAADQPTTNICMILWMRHTSRDGDEPLIEPSHLSVFLNEADAVQSIKDYYRKHTENPDTNWSLSKAGEDFIYPAGPNNAYNLYTPELPADHPIIATMLQNNERVVIPADKFDADIRHTLNNLQKQDIIPIPFPVLHNKPSEETGVGPLVYTA